MLRQILFWWECVREAARGTVKWANAWGYLVGAAVIAFVAYFGWGLQLQLPSTLPEYFASALLCLTAAWIVAFLVRLTGAPARLYWKLRLRLDALSKDDRRFFMVEQNIYTESRPVKWTVGDRSDFFETIFYLVVGNGLGDGKTLRRVQTRIFFTGEPSLAKVKETASSETDIRHGEWAFFEIGRMISNKPIGIIQPGDITLNDEAQTIYSHNILLGNLSFEVYAPTNKRLYGLSFCPKQPNVWATLLVISADDAQAMQVRVKIDMANTVSPVSTAEG